MTSAYCVTSFRKNPSKLLVRCGEWNTTDLGEIEEKKGHQDRQVVALEIHPEFDSVQYGNLHNDFAVLLTSEEFGLSSHINTTCLPQPGESFDGTTCFATGWGKDKFGSSGKYQVILKEIILPMVNHTDCQDKLRQNTRLGINFNLHESFVCAGGIRGVDTCTGDGGGPLVCPSKNDPNTYIQAGIVSWGIGCGEENVPGVYADVSQATCWIDKVVTCYYGASAGSSLSSYFGFTSDICQFTCE